MIDDSNSESTEENLYKDPDKLLRKVIPLFFIGKTRANGFCF